MIISWNAAQKHFATCSFYASIQSIKASPLNSRFEQCYELDEIQLDDTRSAKLQIPYWISNHQVSTPPYKYRLDVGVTKYGEGKFYYWTVTCDRAVAVQLNDGNDDGSSASNGDAHGTIHIRKDQPLYLIAMEDIEYYGRSIRPDKQAKLQAEKLKLLQDYTCHQVLFRTPLTDLMIEWLKLDDDGLAQVCGESDKRRLTIYRQSIIFHLYHLRIKAGFVSSTSLDLYSF